jgi:hypothetical protein
MMVNWLTRAAQWIEARASQAPGGKLMDQGRRTSTRGAKRSTAGARTEAPAPEAPRGTQQCQGRRISTTGTRNSTTGPGLQPPHPRTKKMNESSSHRGTVNIGKHYLYSNPAPYHLIQRQWAPSL